jgi:hypothetical protein
LKRVACAEEGGNFTVQKERNPEYSMTFSIFAVEGRRKSLG